MRRIALWAIGGAALALGTGHAATIGEAPPDYLGRTLQGDEVRISDRRGKVVMVSFWASWCGYCRKQFPMLDAFQRVFPPEQLEVIVVNYKEPVRDYRAVVRQLREATVTWTHDADGAISDAFGVDAVPQLFVVDKYGELAHVQAGYSAGGPEALETLVRGLLVERGPADLVPIPVARPDASLEDSPEE